MRHSTYKYGISAVCRMLGVTIGNVSVVRRNLSELGFDEYLESGVYKIPEGKIAEVIRQLKDLRAVPKGYVTIREIHERTGFSIYAVRKYLKDNEVKCMWINPKATKVYSLKDPKVIGYLNRTRR